MRSWATPAVPSLAERGLGTGLAPTVRDTASGELLRVAPADAPARMYVCGITPYDATHLGHAATYVTFDVLQRVWRDAGLAVTYTQNVTDVDDPLLARAQRDGEGWQQLAERETELFRSDMEALRVLPPDQLLGVTEAMGLVIALVRRLVDVGAAYRVDDDLYFDVRADPEFASLSHLDAATMRVLAADRGGDPDRPGKRGPLDPPLWMAARPGEPSWDSPYGRGRPGWHVECSALAVEHLGMGFDVQGGGTDLVFPHHELSASQARAAYGGEPFARAYVHQAMVGLDGAKMSKSDGNLVLISRLRADGVDPAAIRLALLAHRYDAEWQWGPGELTAAEQRLAAWRKAVGGGAGKASAETVEALRSALADDLDTPRALQAVDRWADAGGGAGGGGGDDVAAAVDALLGVAL